MREAASQRRNEIVDFWKFQSWCQAEVLFTCNRIEVYGAGGNNKEIEKYSYIFRRHFGGLFLNAYEIQGRKQIFSHILGLACGLESQLKGECQIVQQISAWQERVSLPVPLADLWRQALRIAHKIRYQAGLHGGMSTIAGVVFDDMRRQGLAGRHMNIIVVGTGMVAELIARHFGRYARVHFVARKNKKRARQLAKITGGDVIDREQLKDTCFQADVVISATSSPHYVVAARHLNRAAERQKQPLLVYDLSLPRDVDPQVAKIEGVILKNLDDLNDAFCAHNQRRAGQLRKAASLVEDYVEIEEPEDVLVAY